MIGFNPIDFLGAAASFLKTVHSGLGAPNGADTSAPAGQGGFPANDVYEKAGDAAVRGQNPMDPCSHGFDSWFNARFCAPARRLMDAIGLTYTLSTIQRIAETLLEKNLDDPALMSEHPLPGSFVRYRETVGGELFGKDGPSASDVCQGWAGDCYLHASLAAVAAQDPDAIREMIVDNADGTYDVRFYLEEPPGSGIFNEKWVTVDDDLPYVSLGNELLDVLVTDSPLAATLRHVMEAFHKRSFGNEAYALAKDSDLDGREEIWVAIVEKAFAKFNEEYQVLNDVGGMDGIGSGGPPTETLEWLTGEPFAHEILDDLSEAELWQRLSAANQGAAMVTGIRGDEVVNGIYPHHAYTVLGTTEIDGERYVLLRNPWGHGEPPGNGHNDGVFKLPFKEFQELFGDICRPPLDTQPQLATAWFAALRA